MARHRFEVELDPIPDALQRVLCPFAVRQAVLASVRHDQATGGGLAVLETAGLDPAAAELIVLRLAQMPWVRRARVREMRPAPEMAGA